MYKNFKNIFDTTMYLGHYAQWNKSIELYVFKFNLIELFKQKRKDITNSYSTIMKENSHISKCKSLWAVYAASHAHYLSLKGLCEYS